MNELTGRVVEGRGVQTRSISSSGGNRRLYWFGCLSWEHGGAILQSPSVFSISPVPTFYATYTFRFALTWQALTNPALYLPMVSEFDSSLLSDRIPNMFTRPLS